MKQLLWHLVWILLTLWAVCQKMHAGAFTHVFLVAAVVLLVFNIMKHDKVAFVKTFRDSKMSYLD